MVEDRLEGRRVRKGELKKKGSVSMEGGEVLRK